MTLPISIEMIAAAYEYFRTTPPYSRWNLPDSEDVIFKVVKDPHLEAWHNAKGRGKSRKQIVAVSEASVGHTISLMGAVAYEMLHLHQDITKQSTPGTEHNAAFKKDAAKICRVHGFDEKRF